MRAQEDVVMRMRQYLDDPGKAVGDGLRDMSLLSGYIHAHNTTMTTVILQFKEGK